MERIRIVKTQLEEAARFAKSSTPGHDRMAVILMDNFVELQLGRQMHFRFRFDFLSGSPIRKFPINRRKEIMMQYDKILKVCVEEKIISAGERTVLQFSHDIRNRIYHQGEEDSLLIKVALHALHSIIVRHQPDWKGGTDIIYVGGNFEHPFTVKRIKKLGAKKYEHGSREDWEDFLAHHFDVLDKRKKSPSRILSEFALRKLRYTKRIMELVLSEAAQKTFFKHLKGWGFNDFLLHYSFKNTYAEELQRLVEMNDTPNSDRIKENMFNEYQQKYRSISAKRISSLEKSAKELAKFQIELALEKYIGMRTELLIIHDAFAHARYDLDQEIGKQNEQFFRELQLKSSGSK